MADADVSEEDQNNLLKFLEKKETEYMRLQRHKMGVDDFELLTMIGKGAFGEVCSSYSTPCPCLMVLLWHVCPCYSGFLTICHRLDPFSPPPEYWLHILSTLDKMNILIIIFVLGH